SPIPSGDVLDLLTSLVEKSLVVYEEQEGGARYRMLETVRQYFSERLRASGEEAQIRGQHLACFLALAEQAEPQLMGAQQGTWYARLESEHDNLRAALDWAFGPGRWALGSSPLMPNAQGRTPSPEAGLRLAALLMRFWVVRGYLAEGRERLGKALAAAPEATA